MRGEIDVGTLVVSRSTGRKAMVAVVPVLDDGSVIGALGISLFLAELSDLIAADVGAEVLYAIDGEGAFTLHTVEALIAEAASPEDLEQTEASTRSLGRSFPGTSPN